MLRCGLLDGPASQPVAMVGHGSPQCLRPAGADPRGALVRGARRAQCVARGESTPGPAAILSASLSPRCLSGSMPAGSSASSAPGADQSSSLVVPSGAWWESRQPTPTSQLATARHTWSIHQPDLAGEHRRLDSPSAPSQRPDSRLNNETLCRLRADKRSAIECL